MKNLLKFFLSLTLLTTIVGCTNKHGKRHIHVYKIAGNQTNSSASDDWIFWYIIMNNSSSGGCYSYSSSTPVTNFSKVNFSASSTVPSEVDGKEEIEQVEVNEQDLSEETQSDMDTESEATESDSSIGNDNSESGSDSSSDSDGGSSDGGE